MLSLNNLTEKDKNQKRTTTTITFRKDNNIMHKINAKAEQEDISLNTLINQILKRYAEWDMYEGKAGMVPLNRPVVKKLFEGLSKEEIINMSRDLAKDAVYNIALFMKGQGKLDVESFLSWFLSRMKNCSEIVENKENHTITYIMKHDLGENWSLYHKTVLETVFNEIFHRPIDITINGDALVFKIREYK